MDGDIMATIVATQTYRIPLTSSSFIGRPAKKKAFKDKTATVRPQHATRIATQPKNYSPIIQHQITDPQLLHKRELKTWELISRLNEYTKYEDPLTYADQRLSNFYETYDTLLKKSIAQRKNPNTRSPSTLVKQWHDEPGLNERIDLIGHWSLCALKMISGVDDFITNRAIPEFSNFQLKNNEAIKIINIQEEFFGQQWSWQLGLDNRDSDIYDFTFKPKVKPDLLRLGPPNLHTDFCDTLTSIPYPDNFFSMAICYDSWLQFRNDDWIPSLTEIHRVMAPGSYIHIFLYDYDIINCVNRKYQNFFEKIQKILKENDIDPFPSKNIHQRLKDSGFKDINYSYVSLKKGIPNNMGHLLDFLQSYFEFIIFDKIASIKMSKNDLQEFKEVKMKYHQAVKSGKLVTEFGSGYCMTVFAKKC